MKIAKDGLWMRLSPLKKLPAKLQYLSLYQVMRSLLTKIPVMKKTQLRNLPRNQKIANATVAVARTQCSHRDETKEIKIALLVQGRFASVILELKHIVIRPSVADFPRTPSDVFQLFLDDKAIEHLTAETVKYAFQYGNHNFF